MFLLFLAVDFLIGELFADVRFQVYWVRNRCLDYLRLYSAINIWSTYSPSIMRLWTAFISSNEESFFSSLSPDDKFMLSYRAFFDLSILDIFTLWGPTSLIISDWISWLKLGCSTRSFLVDVASTLLAEPLIFFITKLVVSWPLELPRLN